MGCLGVFEQTQGYLIVMSYGNASACCVVMKLNKCRKAVSTHLELSIVVVTFFSVQLLDAHLVSGLETCIYYDYD
jgi:uncharacterized protein YdbL (DUF1318 family)